MKQCGEGDDVFSRVGTLVTSSPMQLFVQPSQLRDKKTDDNDCPIKEECERICAKYVRTDNAGASAIEFIRRECRGSP